MSKIWNVAKLMFGVILLGLITVECSNTILIYNAGCAPVETVFLGWSYVHADSIAWTEFQNECLLYEDAMRIDAFSNMLALVVCIIVMVLIAAFRPKVFDV